MLERSSNFFSLLVVKRSQTIGMSSFCETKGGGGRIAHSLKVAIGAFACTEKVSGNITLREHKCLN